MIRQIIHKGFSVFLAILLLFSTISFTIEKHYCGEILVDVAMFSDVKKCGMEMSNSDVSNMMKKHCCKDEIEVIQGQDELKLLSLNDLQFDSQVFITSLIYSYISLFECLPKQIIPHKDYSPPNLVADIQVLDQIFLI